MAKCILHVKQQYREKMKEFGRHFKIRLFFILLAGFAIVTSITAIATYAIYQNRYSYHLNHAQKIIQLYRTTYHDILKDLSYLKLLDFNTPDENIIQKFQKFGKVIYSNNQLVNSISLVKQFENQDRLKELHNFALITHNPKFKFIPFQKIIPNSKKASNNTLISILIYRIPEDAPKNVIGLELSSEEKRKETIDTMNITGLDYLTPPLKLVNEDIKYNHSSVLYYPLHKTFHSSFYDWYVVVTMTQQKILNLFMKKHFYFKNYIIDIYTTDTDESKDYIKVASNTSKKVSSTQLITQDFISFGNQEQKITIAVQPQFLLNDYWPVLLGFSSGIFFLIGIGYYLYYKEQKEMQIQELVQTDYLTKIYNRTYFDEQLELACKKYRRYGDSFSIILLDIDHFKDINDTFGHAQGDKILVSLAKLLQTSLRNVDILSRWGGEEFIILLHHTTIEQATEIAEKLRRQIERSSFSIPSKVTCSFGVTQVFLEDTIASCFMRVDKALYEAKNSGRNKVSTVC